MSGPTASPATLKPKIGLTAEEVIELAINGLRNDKPGAVLRLLEDSLQASRYAREEKSENSLAPDPKIE